MPSPKRERSRNSGVTHVKPRNDLQFLIIGAQKAGTTSLHEYLRRHRDLYLPIEKECPFFSHDLRHAKGWDDYFAEYFGAAPDGAVLGKATPHYMWGAPYQRTDDGSLDSPEWVIPQRIRDRLPNVKLIALLRDPVERCVSQFRMAQLNKFEQRELNEGLAELLTLEGLESSRHTPRERNSYIVLGEYGRLLTPYFELFDREQLLILFTDQLAKDPRGVLRRVLEFIGVDADFTPPNLGERYRVGTTQHRTDFDPHSLRRWARDNRLARRAWTALPKDTRSSAYRAYSRWVYRFKLWNRRPGSAPPPAELAPEVRRRLDAVYSEDAARLEALIGETPTWSAAAAVR